MKLTKLLAMLLALCMILCCFAACGDSDDDKDDDKDEKVEDKDKDEDEDEGEGEDEDEDEDEDKDDGKSDKNDKKDDEDDKKNDAKTEGIEGKWKGTSDFGALVADMYDVELDAVLELTYVFEFNDDGEYTLSAKLPSESQIEKFAEAMVDCAIDQYMVKYGADSPEELAETLGYESYEDFYEDGYEAYLETVGDSLESMETEEKDEYEYEDGVIVFGGKIEVEIDLDGDTFTIESSDDENYEMILGGVKFERQ